MLNLLSYLKIEIKKYDVLCEDIRKLIKSYCYGFDNDTLSGVVGQILISKKSRYL